MPGTAGVHMKVPVKRDPAGQIRIQRIHRQLHHPFVFFPDPDVMLRLLPGGIGEPKSVVRPGSDRIIRVVPRRSRVIHVPGIDPVDCDLVLALKPDVLPQSLHRDVHGLPYRKNLGVNVIIVKRFEHRCILLALPDKIPPGDAKKRISSPKSIVKSLQFFPLDSLPFFLLK